MFLFIRHPLAIGFILLIQTLIICLITGLVTKTFWFSYVLFLIFVGGILVLFIYVTSLASNEIFNFSRKISFSSLFIFFTFLVLLLFIDKRLFVNYFLNYETESLKIINSFLLENTLTLNKLYNFPINIITIIIIIYLFLTLIAVVKITNIFEGPLRPNF